MSISLITFILVVIILVIVFFGARMWLSSKESELKEIATQKGLVVAGEPDLKIFDYGPFFTAPQVKVSGMYQ